MIELSMRRNHNRSVSHESARLHNEWIPQRCEDGWFWWGLLMHRPLQDRPDGNPATLGYIGAWSVRDD